MTTALYSISPEDGWVQVVPASAKFVKIRQYPQSQPFFITSAASTPAVNDVLATGTITFSGGVPTAAQTMVVGATTYTFVASASTATEITIGADAATTATNAAAKISANSTDVQVVGDNGAGVLSLRATVTGTAGNSTVLTSAATHVAVSGAGTFTGGVDGVIGYRMDCDEDAFWTNVLTTDKYYARVENPKADTKLKVYAFWFT